MSWGRDFWVNYSFNAILVFFSQHYTTVLSVCVLSAPESWSVLNLCAGVHGNSVLRAGDSCDACLFPLILTKNREMDQGESIKRRIHFYESWVMSNCKISSVLKVCHAVADRQDGYYRNPKSILLVAERADSDIPVLVNYLKMTSMSVGPNTSLTC